MGTNTPVAWIALGALVATTSGAALAREAMVFTPSQQGHWAWKKPLLPAVPKVANRAWVATPLDAFVLTRLEAKKLRPAKTASREQLIRRLAFDLTGLPPTPAEIDAFLADTSPRAWSKVVDHYLASPAFGERWARHWLDLARYADSNGYEFDEARPDAWRYRDYVVRSFNADKPYDRFVREQIAGDEIAADDPDSLIATGFNLLGPDMTDAADQAARRQNTLNDMTDTTGLVFLGLTLGCARCHNHKYEPLPAEDYYKLQSFFVAAKFRNDVPAVTAAQKAEHEWKRLAYETSLRSAQSELDAVSGATRERIRRRKIGALREDLQTAFETPAARRTAEQKILVQQNAKAVEPSANEIRAETPAELRPRLDQAQKAIAAAERLKPAPLPKAICLSEDGADAPKTFVLERGELSNRAHEVAPGFPVILAAAPPALAPAGQGRTSGRRTALAAWIASKENPLTARVMANRVWQHLMGRGIIPTPSDFGVRGDSPTHPELLDWLAAMFATTGRAVNGSMGQRVNAAPKLAPINPLSPSPIDPYACGWSVKQLIRVIVTSNTYKQSSIASAATVAADPDNELFSRMNRKRLEAEAIRDAVLAISGRLNPKLGGPGVFPPIPAEALPPKSNVWPVSSDPADHTRRSLYTFVRRNMQFPALEVFDSPDTNSSCARREVTTSAPQALSLLNSPEMGANARALAARILREAQEEDARIALAYRLTLARKPTAAEVRFGHEFLKTQTTILAHGATNPQDTALADYCLALMNLNEFVYLD